MLQISRSIRVCIAFMIGMLLLIFAGCSNQAQQMPVKQTEEPKNAVLASKGVVAAGKV